MSLEAEDNELQSDIEQNTQLTNRQLNAIIFLLEIIANQDPGTAMETAGD